MWKTRESIKSHSVSFVLRPSGRSYLSQLERHLIPMSSHSLQNSKKEVSLGVLLKLFHTVKRWQNRLGWASSLSSARKPATH